MVHDKVNTYGTLTANGNCRRLRHDTKWWNIGGPDTILPRFIESFLCWSLALSCLSISGYHFIMDNYVTIVTTSSQAILIRYIFNPLRLLYLGQCESPTKNTSISSSCSSTKSQQPQFPCWLPLMTFSRAELQRGTPHDRYIQLLQVIDSINPNYLIRRNTNQYHLDDGKEHRGNRSSFAVQCTLSDKELIEIVRQNEIVRRLVSLALRPSSVPLNDDVRSLPLGQQLIRIWSHLLALPQIPYPEALGDFKTPTTGTTPNIALIIPCYREATHDIVDKLKYALRNCHQPQQVQVRLVMAGKNATIDQQNLQSALQELENDDCNHWGDVQVLEFLEESGRGPCLNYGAMFVSRTHEGDGSTNSGSDTNILVYTFCHSDTRLPYHWDRTLMQTLYPPPTLLFNQHHQYNSSIAKVSSNHKRITSCAYRFGIDTSGLRKRSHGPIDAPSYYPPGIHAIEVTANLRCTFWSLPYGDQCISMRKDDFHYLGGFPHQCLMEDYELITLLRKRMKLLSLFRRDDSHTGNSNMVQEETLQILSGPPVRCSPRRWQKFGVFYVTYTNSRLVQLYNNNKNNRDAMTQPEDIYKLYYGQNLDVVAPKSPWEVELEQILNKTR